MSGGPAHPADPVPSGADRDRTGDPLLAKQVLSQLSYSPENEMDRSQRRMITKTPIPDNSAADARGT